MTAAETWPPGVTCSPPSLSPAQQLQRGYFLPCLLAGASLAPAPGTWWAWGGGWQGQRCHSPLNLTRPADGQTAPGTQHWQHCDPSTLLRQRGMTEIPEVCADPLSWPGPIVGKERDVKSQCAAKVEIVHVEDDTWHLTLGPRTF